MANEYSIEIHQYLTENIATAEKFLEESLEDKSFYQGVIEELFSIRKYLSDNMDLKDFTYY